MWEGTEVSEAGDVSLCRDATRRPSTDGALPTVADGVAPAAYTPTSRDGHWLTIAEMEREHIRQTLERAFYNQSQTARLLGIERHQLARKIGKYGLETPRAKRARY